MVDLTKKFLIERNKYCSLSDDMRQDFWKALGTKRKIVQFNGVRFSILSPLDTVSVTLVLCPVGNDYTIEEAETWGFGHLCSACGLTTVFWRETRKLDIPCILTLLVKNGIKYSESKIYICCFGEGGTYALEYGAEYPSIISGVAVSASEKAISGVKKMNNGKIPIILIGGGDDASAFPANSLKYDTAMENIAALAGTHLIKNCRIEEKSTVRKRFGYEFEHEYYAFVEGKFWYVGDNGRLCAVLGYGVGEEITPSMVPFIYCFFKNQYK